MEAFLTNTQVRRAQTQTLWPALKVIVNIDTITSNARLLNGLWWGKRAHCETLLHCFPVNFDLLNRKGLILDSLSVRLTIPLGSGGSESIIALMSVEFDSTSAFF